jgi:hypothetical protein
MNTALCGNATHNAMDLVAGQGFRTAVMLDALAMNWVVFLDTGTASGRCRGCSAVTGPYAARHHTIQRIGLLGKATRTAVMLDMTCNRVAGQNHSDSGDAGYDLQWVFEGVHVGAKMAIGVVEDGG